MSTLNPVETQIADNKEQLSGNKLPDSQNEEENTTAQQVAGLFNKNKLIGININSPKLRAPQ